MDIEVITQIAIAIGIVLIFRILSSAVACMIIKLLTYKKGEKKQVKKNPFYLPLKTIFTFIGIYIGLYMIKDVIAISEKAESIIEKTMKIAMILFVAKSFAVGLNDKNIIVSKLRDKSNKDIDNVTMNAILRTARIAIYILAGFMVISELGYNISGFVTGIGIGGVVLTLAAQDTAKNLFGGLVIFLDKPFVVGDWIEVENYEGTVEDITFRSTRVRTFENSLVNIPNSIISNASIINWSKMEKRRYRTNLCLAKDTPLEKLERFKTRVEDMLQSREAIFDDSIIVKFDTIANNGLNVLICSYTDSVDYTSYLSEREDINCKIMKILKEENIELAYDTKTVYVKN